MEDKIQRKRKSSEEAADRTPKRGREQNIPFLSFQQRPVGIRLSDLIPAFRKIQVGNSPEILFIEVNFLPTCRM